MKQVEYDPEEGEFDADIIETGQSKSQRERRQMILNTIDEFEGVSLGELIDSVEIDNTTIRHNIGSLKQIGRIYLIDREVRTT